MLIFNIIKEHWVILSFVVVNVLYIYKMGNTIYSGVKNSIRINILQIYENTKNKKEISRYELMILEESYDLYKRLNGNSFITDIVTEIKKYKII